MTNEQIAEIQRIVDGAPEYAGQWDESLQDYYEDESERNLNDLRTIIAQHEEIASKDAELARLREQLNFRENQIGMALSHNSMSYLLGQPPKGELTGESEC